MMFSAGVCEPWVQLEPGHYVQRADIVDLVWENRFYANGSERKFVVKMRNGSQYVFEGAEAAVIEQRITGGVK